MYSLARFNIRFNLSRGRPCSKAIFDSATRSVSSILPSIADSETRFRKCSNLTEFKTMRFKFKKLGLGVSENSLFQSNIEFRCRVARSMRDIGCLNVFRSGSL